MLDPESAGTILAFDQERRLLSEEWARDQSVRNIQRHLSVAVTLREEISIQQIETALNHVVAGHKPLRSTFAAVPGASSLHRSRIVADSYHSGVSIGGLHHVKCQSEAAITVTEATVHPTDSLIDAVHRESETPFDLGSAPMLRGAVLKNESDRLLILTADALVVDWASMSSLLLELRAEVCGHERQPKSQPQRAHRPPSVLQYREALTHWKTEWKELGLRLLDSEDFPYALPESFFGGPLRGTARLVLGQGLSEGLRRLTDRNGRGLTCTILTAYAIALQHATQRTTFSIWTDFRQPAGGIGPYSHSHAVTLAPAEADCFDEVATSVQSSIEAVRRFQHIPLDLVWRSVEKCPVPKTGQVSFQHVELRGDKTVGDIGSDAWPLSDTDPRMSLLLRSYDNGLNIGLCANYAAPRFRAESIRALLAAAHDVLALAVDQNDGLASTSVPSMRSTSGAPERCYLCSRARARGQHQTNSKQGCDTLDSVFAFRL